MKKILVLLVAVLSCSIGAEAQSSIKISGIVKDASTKEAIPLVAVRFENSRRGTSTILYPFYSANHQQLLANQFLFFLYQSIHPKNLGRLIAVDVLSVKISFQLKQV